MGETGGGGAVGGASLLRLWGSCGGSAEYSGGLGETLLRDYPQAGVPGAGRLGELPLYDALFRDQEAWALLERWNGCGDGRVLSVEPPPGGRRTLHRPPRRGWRVVVPALGVAS